MQASKLNGSITSESENDSHYSSASEARLPHGFLERLCGSFCHRHHLVHALALPLLPQSLLRPLRAEFLPLLARLSRRPPVRLLGHTRAAPADNRPPFRCVSPSGIAKRHSSDHASDGPVLYRPGCLRDLHALVGHHDRLIGSRLLSRGALDHSPMAIPGRHASWCPRSNRRPLVSTRMGNRTRSL